MDKSKWPEGPWQKESDEVKFSHEGFQCLIVRIERMGHLCGYVAVKAAHPWFGKDYDDIHAQAHGGITFAAALKGEPDELFWVGFDCAHYMDVIPSLIGIIPLSASGTYKDMAFVRKEVEELAAQAKLAYAHDLEARNEARKSLGLPLLTE
jgi:hypothetical protein